MSTFFSPMVIDQTTRSSIVYDIVADLPSLLLASIWETCIIYKPLALLFNWFALYLPFWNCPIISKRLIKIVIQWAGTLIISIKKEGWQGTSFVKEAIGDLFLALRWLLIPSKLSQSSSFKCFIIMKDNLRRNPSCYYCWPSLEDLFGSLLSIHKSACICVESRHLAGISLSGGLLGVYIYFHVCAFVYMCIYTFV